MGPGFVKKQYGKRIGSVLWSRCMSKVMPGPAMDEIGIQGVARALVQAHEPKHKQSIR